MTLNDIIHSPNAAQIQVVINAEDLRKCFEDFTAWGMQQIKERDEPKYYTRDELEQLLHVTAPTLMHYRKKGLIPEPVTIEGRVLYNKAEIHKAIADRKVFIKKIKGYETLQT